MGCTYGEQAPPPIGSRVVAKGRESISPLGISRPEPYLNQLCELGDLSKYVDSGRSIGYDEPLALGERWLRSRSRVSFVKLPPPIQPMALNPQADRPLTTVCSRTIRSTSHRCSQPLSPKQALGMVYEDKSMRQILFPFYHNII